MRSPTTYCLTGSVSVERIVVADARVQHLTALAARIRLLCREWRRKELNR